MKVQNVELTISAVSPAQYPNEGFPEIALSGRSNVGKSSLINTLINRKGLARTSSQPGKTQTLNFYNIESELYFVDVPGYGYAKVSKKDREKWGQMIDFLHYYDLPILVCATKMDKIPRGKWNRTESQIRKKLALNPQDEIVLFSSVTKAGKEEVWNWVEKMSGIKGD